MVCQALSFSTGRSDMVSDRWLGGASPTGLDGGNRQPNSKGVRGDPDVQVLSGYV